MKKLLLSIAAAALALSVNAQGIKASSPGYAWDNFSSSTEFAEAGSTYGIFFYKDTLNEAAEYTKDGITYSDGKISFVKTRTGNGLLNYTITSPYNAFNPTGFSFGTGNSINVATSPVVTLKFSNQSDSTLYVRVALKDVNGNVVNSRGQQAANQGSWYVDEIGFIVSPSNEFSYNPNASDDIVGAVNGTQDADSVEVTLDFASGYDANYGTGVADSTSFDFTQVAEIQLTVLNNNQVEEDGYARKGLSNVSYALSFVGVGDVSTILGLENGLTTASEEIVSAYDMLGNFIGKGKIKELNLESGRVYIVRSSKETKKIVMVK